VGEQEDYYDPSFTYREGDEVGKFVSDEPEGCATDVGPSGAGESKESPIASSSRRLVAEPMASTTVEGEPSAVTFTKALRTVEHLPEPASCALAGSSASPITVGVSVTEPITVSTTVEGAPKNITEETIKSGAMTNVVATPFGNAMLSYK